ncbi:MAG: DUF3298 and DUF4163 domain-containing protein [Bacteroidales bacterium]|nr:DUF3298 and DUF4163 domain-containing protein [Bacteroidales bacterium]MCF8403964.1 DUF3298 and DUF4163 domain-containing protein [Bacteroidales bacterium]
MSLSLDLFEHSGNLSGYYFYFFRLPGEDSTFHYGKTIPFEGSFYGNVINFHEFGNKASKFQGIIDGNEIYGSWQRREYEDPIPFHLTEDYSAGSIALNCFTAKRKQDLIHELIKGDNLPSARINILILYPKNTLKGALKDSIDFLITRFLAGDPFIIKSPELLMENIVFDFFQSYITATQGISNISKREVFNWEKDLTMDVMYNSNQILSLGFEKYAFTGGEHGLSMKKYAVFDLQKSKVLQLKDFLILGFEISLNEILDKKLRKINGVKPDESLNNAGFLIDKIDFTENFYINNDGIGFYYNVYHLASFGSGSTELFVNFNEIKNLLIQDHPFKWVK